MFTWCVWSIRSIAYMCCGPCYTGRMSCAVTRRVCPIIYTHGFCCALFSTIHNILLCDPLILILQGCFINTGQYYDCPSTSEVTQGLWVKIQCTLLQNKTRYIRCACRLGGTVYCTKCIKFWLHRHHWVILDVILKMYSTSRNVLCTGPVLIMFWCACKGYR